jgi:hypothetical protein
MPLAFSTCQPGPLTTGDKVNLGFGAYSLLTRVCSLDPKHAQAASVCCPFARHSVTAAGVGITLLGGFLYLARYRYLQLTTEQCYGDNCNVTFTPLRKGKDLYCYKCLKKREMRDRMLRLQAEAY